MRDTDPRTSRQIVRDALPLRITYADIAPDPILVLAGDNWGSNFAGDWILSGPEIYIDCMIEGVEPVTDEELLTAEDVKTLVGRDIIGVTANEDLHGPIFHMSGGIDLIVRHTSEIEPWVISLPEITLVGEPRAVEG